jgi:hypothetical protein
LDLPKLFSQGELVVNEQAWLKQYQ